MTKLQSVYMDQNEDLHRIFRSKGGARGRWLVAGLFLLIAVSGKGPWAALMFEEISSVSIGAAEQVVSDKEAPKQDLHYSRQDLNQTCDQLDLQKVWADFHIFAALDLNGKWDKMEQMQTLGALLVRCGSKSDHLQLLSMAESRLKKVDEESSDYVFTSTLDTLLDALLARRLEEDLAGFAGRGRPLFPLLDENVQLPSYLTRASVDLQEAWSLAQRVRIPLQEWEQRISDERVPENPDNPWGGPYSYSQNSASFYLQLIAMLKNPRPGQTEELAKFHWGSWCGTGSGNFQNLRNQGLLFGLAQEGLHAEAVGALLASRQTWPMMLRKSDQVVNEWGAHVGYLRNLELDPAMLMIGGLFSGTYSYGPAREVTLKMLGSMGEEKAVNLILDLGDLPPATFQDWEHWGFALSTFLERNGCKRPSHYENPDGSVTVITANPGMKLPEDKPLRLTLYQMKRINAQVDRAVAGNYGPRAGVKGVQMLALDCLRNTESRLLKGLKAPSNDIRDAAAAALQTLGFSTKKVVALPDLKIRLELSGYQALNRVGVYQNLGGTHSAARSWRAETKDGLVKIERDSLLSTSEPVEDLFLLGGSYAEWEEPFYLVQINKPWGFHQVENIVLEGGAFVLIPQTPADWTMPEDGYAIVSLEPQIEELDETTRSLMSLAPSKQMNAEDFAPSFTIPWLQAGRYKLTISYPGLTPYVSEVFEVGSDGLIISPVLQYP